jgi:hypothetical protein
MTELSAAPARPPGPALAQASPGFVIWLLVMSAFVMILNERS